MNQPRILLVEDDVFLRDVYTEALTTEGFSVTTAEDGEIGLEKIKEGNWDLILLDLTLPKLDGFQILRQARDSGLTDINKKVVILTNNTINDPDKMQEILELSSEYLIKSDLNPQQFVEKVKEFLNQTTPTKVSE